MSRSAEMRGHICARCTGAGAAAVSRRSFLSTATLAAVAAALEACGGVTGLSNYSGSVGGPLSVTLSNYSALATVGGLARVDNGSGAPTALVRTGASSFIGVTMVCTHQGGILNINGAGFLCPNHGARFSETGTWEGGQIASNLATYAATFDGVNTVTIARPS